MFIKLLCSSNTIQTTQAHIVEKRLQNERRACIADAILMGLVAAAALSLGLSILFPPLAIPFISAAVMSSGASLGLTAVTTGVIITALSLILTMGCIKRSIEAHEKTRLLANLYKKVEID